MKSLFVAIDSDSLYKSWRYSVYINNQSKSSYESDLIWMPTIKTNWNITQMFNKVYTVPSLYVEKLNWNTRFDPNGITDLLLLKYTLYKNKINVEEYDHVFIFKDTTLREQKLLESTGEGTTVTYIEEGIATYKDNTNHAIHPSIRQIFCHFPPLLKTLRPEIVRRIGEKNIHPISKSVYSKEKSKKYIKNIYNKSINITKKKFDVLYIGQIKNNERAIARRLSKLSANKKFGLKPHPREKIEYTGNENMEILNCKLPVEILYPLIDHPVILTYSSSAAFRLARIYNAKVILIYPLFSNKDAASREKIKRLMKIYNNIKLSNIYITHDYREYSDMVESSHRQICPPTSPNKTDIEEIDEILSFAR